MDETCRWGLNPSDKRPKRGRPSKKEKEAFDGDEPPLERPAASSSSSAAAPKISPVQGKSSDPPPGAQRDAEPEEADDHQTSPYDDKHIVPKAVEAVQEVEDEPSSDNALQPSSDNPPASSKPIGAETDELIGLRLALSEWNRRTKDWDIPGVRIYADEQFGPLTNNDDNIRILTGLIISSVKDKLAAKSPRIDDDLVLKSLSFLFYDRIILRSAYVDKNQTHARAPPEFLIKEWPIRIQLTSIELREWTIHDAEDLRGVSPLHRKAAHERSYEWSITLHGDQPSLRRIDAGQPQLKQLDIKPQFDFKNVISRLQDPEIDEHAAIALVRGIHEKFWHATVKDLALLLHRAQLPRPIVALAKIVVSTCKECRPLCTTYQQTYLEGRARRLLQRPSTV